MHQIYKIVGTGSSGNCYIYNKDLMIDIGLPWKKIELYYKDIKLLLLTHQHGDHINISSLKKFIFERPSLIILCCDFLIDFLKENGIYGKNIYILHIDKQYDLGKYLITPVYAPHDVRQLRI